MDYVEAAVSNIPAIAVIQRFDLTGTPPENHTKSRLHIPCIFGAQSYLITHPLLHEFLHPYARSTGYDRGVVLGTYPVINTHKGSAAQTPIATYA